jgi:hypothetical protein
LFDAGKARLHSRSPFGVAALVWSHFTHTDLGDRGRDVFYGFGLVQAKATYDAIATLGCGR